MAFIVADTDVLIDYLSDRGKADQVTLELRTGTLGTTVISAYELWSGARSARQRTQVGQLLDALEILPLEAASAQKSAELRRAMEARGKPIGMADALIAGICITRDTVLLTRNVKHFREVEGLSLSGEYPI